MFHWICPECGREIPPAVKECPACDPKAQVEKPLAAAPSPVEKAVPVVEKIIEKPVAPVAASPVAPPPLLAAAPVAAVPAPVEKIEQKLAPVAAAPVEKIEEKPAPVEKIEQKSAPVATAPIEKIEEQPAPPIAASPAPVEKIEQRIVPVATASAPAEKIEQKVTSAAPVEKIEAKSAPIATSPAAAPVPAAPTPVEKIEQKAAPEAAPPAIPVAAAAKAAEKVEQEVVPAGTAPTEKIEEKPATPIAATPAVAPPAVPVAATAKPVEKVEQKVAPAAAAPEKIEEKPATPIATSPAAPPVEKIEQKAAPVAVAPVEKIEEKPATPIATAPAAPSVEKIEQKVAPAAVAPTEKIEEKPATPVAATPVVAPPPIPVAAAAKSVAASTIEPEQICDPLLALAEQIRAVQTQAAAPVSTPNGLPELATAVGLKEAQAEQTSTIAAAAPATPQVEPVPAVSQQTVETAAAAVTEQKAAPVALLASPAEAPVEPQRGESHKVDAPQADASQALSLIPAGPPPPPAAPVTEQPRAQEPAVEPVAKDAPPSGSWLQLAPLQDYTRAASQSIQPVPPSDKIIATDAGPRMTLPGPTLPPDLARLQEANPVTVLGDPKQVRKSGMPGWLISLLLMIGIPIAGAGILFYFNPVSHSSADAKPPAQEEPAVAAPVPASHPLSQLVEVTGFRIVVDYNKKSEIHYLVVNHSAADLTDMTIFVTLRSGAAKPGQPPLCRFSFKAPQLGPFESKEMISPIEKLTKSISLPDWADLRPEVQIGQ